MTASVPLSRDRMALWKQLADDPAYPWYREPIDVGRLLRIVTAADDLAAACRAYVVVADDDDFDRRLLAMEHLVFVLGRYKARR